MMIQILETKITATMTIKESRAVLLLLSGMPYLRNDFDTFASDFSDDEWKTLADFRADLAAVLAQI